MSEPIRLFQNSRIWQQIGNEVLDLANQSYLRGQAQNGEIALELERQLANKFGRKHCITVACGTDALDIVLQSLNLDPQSPVAVSNYTFTASAHAISRAGHKVIPVDTNQKYCLDFAQLGNVSAVVSVDLFGNMPDYTVLDDITIPVVVDAAQSLESQDCYGKYSASYGIASCISFSPSKTISSWGSGGAILTNDDNVAVTCRKLRLHGKLKNDDIAIAPGLNSMMSSLECAAVLIGLKYSDQWQQRREQIARYLVNNSQYETGNDFSIPKHTLSKLVFKSKQRNVAIEKFKKANIDCVVHYKNLISDEQLYFTNGLSTSKYLRDVSFTVPNQHTLTDSEVERIAQELK